MLGQVDLRHAYPQPAPHFCGVEPLEYIVVKNLELAGISCGCSVMLGTDISADTAMQLFDFYEYVVESAFDGLGCLLARFFCRNGRFYACVDAVCTADLTVLETDEIRVSVSDENYYTLSFNPEGGGFL